MKEIKEEKKWKVDKCPYCPKEIKGSTESQVEYNMKLHIESKHKEEKKDE